MLATVTDKGQVTVPKEIRERLGIRPGAKLDFELLADGELRIKVLARGSEGLFGLLHKPGAPARSVEEMDVGIAAAVAERMERVRS